MLAHLKDIFVPKLDLHTSEFHDVNLVSDLAHQYRCI